MNGKFFAEFAQDDFPDTFKGSCNPSGNVFMQDRRPCQNSKVAKMSKAKIVAVQFSIPLPSPDLKPI